MSSYSVLFACDFQHEFYSGGAGGGGLQFDVIPTLETDEILRRSHCLIKKSSNGFQLLCEVDPADAKRFLPRCSSESNAYLEFSVRSKDKTFYNITSQPEVLDNDSNRCVESSVIYRYVDGLVEKSAIRLLDFSTPITMNPVCIVIVPLDELLRTPISNKIAAQMTINFKSRRVYWRYNIHHHKNTEIVRTIVDRTGEIEFLKVDQSKEASSGYSQFISQQKIPLHSRSHLRFELREQSNGRETVLIDRLPLASPENLRKAPNPAAGLVSDIFLN